MGASEDFELEGPEQGLDLGRNFDKIPRRNPIIS